MTLDDGGGWWFAADRGLFQVRHRELEAVASGGAGSLRAVMYGRDEALPNLQANYGYAPGFTRSRDGRIWFPMRTGLLVVHPDRTPRNRVPPPVVIERLMLDGAPLAGDFSTPLRLPAGHRKLEVDFTAYSFVAPESVAFRHQLEGWDEDWVEHGTQRQVSYSRLPAGEYRLRVAARSSAGEWNPVDATVAFVVAPFVWQTWWFRAGALLLFTAVVVAVVRYVLLRRLRARLVLLEQEAVLQKERARIAKDIHDDLGASLTQISLLGKLVERDLAAPAEAGERVKQMAAAAREGVKAVDEIVWAVNPRNDTVAHLLDYAGQYAVDFLRTAGLRCRVDFPDPVPERELTADARHSLFLVLKEALNNVVKHADATEVWVRGRIAAETLTLTVEDDGRGLVHNREQPAGNGRRNMQQRLAELGGTCRIASRPDRGTEVVATLPLAGEARKTRSRPI
jgi:signal transduction histidine kinase